MSRCYILIDLVRVSMIHDIHVLIILMKALYRFRCFGPPELVEILEMALESQWLHGCLGGTEVVNAMMQRCHTDCLLLGF